MAGNISGAESSVGSVFCEICFQNFNNEDCLPKVLLCGHTLCLQCLRLIVSEEATSTCPKCKSQITGEVETFPTNFFLLQMVNDSSSTDINDEERQIRLMQAKEKLFEKKKSFMELLETKISTLLTFSEAEKIKILLEKTSVYLDDLENYSTHGRRIFDAFLNVEKSVAFNLENYKYPHYFLHEIYDRIKKGEKLHSVHFVEGKIKYGKLQVHEDYVYVFALSDDSLPSNSSCVWFKDIKKCSTSDNYLAFLMGRSDSEDSEERTFDLQVQLQSSSPLAQKFVNLCTGECWSMFKGSRCSVGADFTKNQYSFRSMAKISTSKWTSVEEKLSWPMEAVTEVKTSETLHAGEVIVFASDDGSFHFCTVRVNKLVHLSHSARNRFQELRGRDPYTQLSRHVVGKLMNSISKVLNERIGHRIFENLVIADSGIKIQV